MLLEENFTLRIFDGLPFPITQQLLLLSFSLSLSLSFPPSLIVARGIGLPLRFSLYSKVLSWNNDHQRSEEGEREGERC